MVYEGIVCIGYSCYSTDFADKEQEESKIFYLPITALRKITDPMKKSIFYSSEGRNNLGKALSYDVRTTNV